MFVTSKQLSISGFKAHFTKEIRALEKGDTIIELTRHGKKVAVMRAVTAGVSPPDMKGWIGGGKGTVTYGRSQVNREAQRPAVVPTQ